MIFLQWLFDCNLATIIQSFFPILECLHWGGRDYGIFSCSQQIKEWNETFSASGYSIQNSSINCLRLFWFLEFGFGDKFYFCCFRCNICRTWILQRALTSFAPKWHFSTLTSVPLLSFDGNPSVVTALLGTILVAPALSSTIWVHFLDFFTETKYWQKAYKESLSEGFVHKVVAFTHAITMVRFWTFYF